MSDNPGPIEYDIGSLREQVTGRQPNRGLTGDPLDDVGRIVRRIEHAISLGIYDRTEIDRWLVGIRYVGACLATDNSLAVDPPTEWDGLA